VDDDVFLSPYPTDEEMLDHLVDGTFAAVVSLLDPGNPDDRPWIDKERQILSDYGVPFSLQPISWMNYSPVAARAAADHVRTLPRPVLVHAFLSDGQAAEAFVLAYRSGLLPVSPMSFQEPMTGGQAQVIAPNVVMGPRPSGPEFGNYLRSRGIRAVVYVGDGARADAVHDRTVVAQEAAMPFHALPPEVGRIAALVAAEGPWYIYGPGLGQIQSALGARFAGSLGHAQATVITAAGR